MITEHPHSFESCACVVLGKPGGVGSGDSLAGLLHWTGISVTGSGSAGNIMTSAGPDDNFGRQFWRQFSLMGDTSAIIFQNENCPAIIFGSGHQGLLGHWGRRQFWATILIINWVATAVLSGPRLGSEALVRCSLLDEQLVPSPSSPGSCRAWQARANTSLNKSFLR